MAYVDGIDIVDVRHDGTVRLALAANRRYARYERHDGSPIEVGEWGPQDLAHFHAMALKSNLHGLDDPINGVQVHGYNPDEWIGGGNG